jgi:hypothetical protein
VADVVGDDNRHGVDGRGFTELRQQDLDILGADS